MPMASQLYVRGICHVGRRALIAREPRGRHRGAEPMLAAALLNRPAWLVATLCPPVCRRTKQPFQDWTSLNRNSCRATVRILGETEAKIRECLLRVGGII